jgi:hypothetical protein
MKFFRNGGTTDNRSSLTNADIETRFSKVKGTDKTIVSTADNDCIIG